MANVGIEDGPAVQAFKSVKKYRDCDYGLIFIVKLCCV